MKTLPREKLHLYLTYMFIKFVLQYNLPGVLGESIYYYWLLVQYMTFGAGCSMIPNGTTLCSMLFLMSRARIHGLWCIALNLAIR
jgi:hypothetical protein